MAMELEKLLRLVAENTMQKYKGTEIVVDIEDLLNDDEFGEDIDWNSVKVVDDLNKEISDLEEKLNG